MNNNQLDLGDEMNQILERSLRTPYQVERIDLESVEIAQLVMSIGINIWQRLVIRLAPQIELRKNEREIENNVTIIEQIAAQQEQVLELEIEESIRNEQPTTTVQQEHEIVQKRFVRQMLYEMAQRLEREHVVMSQHDLDLYQDQEEIVLIENL